MSGSWLQEYIADSVRKDRCTRIYCTTCGAMEFRQGVLKAWAIANAVLPPSRFDVESALAIARALSEVHGPHDGAYKWVGAARCLLFDLCAVAGEAAVAQVLGGSWGGDVLRSMQEHSRRRREERATRQEMERTAVMRREERARERQEKHRQRLAEKVRRDAEWRAKQGKGE